MGVFPFLPGAKTVLQEGLVDSDLSDAVAYLKQSVSEGLQAESVWANDGRHVKMYALAKAMLSCLSEAVRRKYASRKASEYVGRANAENRQCELAAAFFESFVCGESGFWLSVGDYLRFGRHLAQMDVQTGKVRVPAGELNELLASAIEARFLEFKAQDVPDFISEKARELDELPPAPKSFGRKFLDLGCIQAVRAGVGEGKRFYGAMGLAIAASRDGLLKEQVQGLMDDYVARCSGTKPFSAVEGKSVVDWVCGKSIGFSCKRMMDDGFEAAYCEKCPLNWKKRRK